MEDEVGATKEETFPFTPTCLPVPLVAIRRVKLAVTFLLALNMIVVVVRTDGIDGVKMHPRALEAWFGISSECSRWM